MNSPIRTKELCDGCGKVYMGTATSHYCPKCRHRINVENGRKGGKLPKRSRERIATGSASPRNDRTEGGPRGSAAPTEGGGQAMLAPTAGGGMGQKDRQ